MATRNEPVTVLVSKHVPCHTVDRTRRCGHDGVTGFVCEECIQMCIGAHEWFRLYWKFDGPFVLPLSRFCFPLWVHVYFWQFIREKIFQIHVNFKINFLFIHELTFIDVYVNYFCLSTE